VSGVTVADLKAMFKKFAETPIVKQRSAKSGKTTKLPSESSRKHLRAATSMFFSSAVDANIIKVNPVSSVRESRKHKKRETDYDALSSDAPSRTKFLSKELRSAILASALKVNEKGLWRTLYLMDKTGMRPSEARVVRPKDFNLTGADIEAVVKHADKPDQQITFYDKSLLVHRALKDGGDIGDTKNQVARCVPIDEEFEAFVKGLDIDPEATIVQNTDGGILDERSYARFFEKAMKSVELPEGVRMPPGATSYWFRHSWTSRAAKVANLVAVAQLAGHDLAVLCKTYAHSDKEQERALVTSIAGL